jgi:hypothetical protein
MSKLVKTMALGLLAWTMPLAQVTLAQRTLAQNSPAQNSPVPVLPTQPFPGPDSAEPAPLSPRLPLPARPVPTPSNPIEQSASTIFEDITLAPAFNPDPATVRGISGGPLAASDLTGRAETATGPCSGFIDQEPDHRMVLTQFFNFLSLQVQSNEDTTLVIRGPGGTWCNNDYSGKNPGIAGQWLSGTYEIWVGSPSTTAFHPYVIRMTEQK